MKNKFLLLAFFTCVNLLFADSVTSKSSEISLNGKVVGKIEVLTPVEIVSNENEPTKVLVKGVVPENYKAQIQKSISNGEIYVIFEEEDDSNFKIINTLEDDYGEIWYEVEGIYDIDKDAITKDSKQLYDRAKKVYEDSCSLCHILHEPNSFTANQWPANIQSMIDLNYVAIEEADISLIIKYLQHNAKENE